MILHNALVIILLFFIQTFLLASEYMIQSGHKNRESFLKRMNAQNNTVGEIDICLFQEHLSHRFNNQNISQTTFRIHDEILNSCSIIDNEKTRKFSPFFISFFNIGKLKQLNHSLNKTDFISKNELNRKFSEKNPEATPIDHCSYVLKSNGMPIGIICCFFNREIILKLLMRFVREM